MEYFQDFLQQQLRKDLKGLTLIQINPDIAIELAGDSKEQGHMYKKENDKWVFFKKASPVELNDIWDQVSDGYIRDASFSSNKQTIKP